MHYAGIIYNDFSAAPGVCLTFFTQGCPEPHCKGCHNPETWDFNAGKEFTDDVMLAILKGLIANGVDRNLCIMGGEPLCQENVLLTLKVVACVKAFLPDTKIYIWTKYSYKELKESKNKDIQYLLKIVDFLIDGPYIESERDVTLSMRGSRNQRIWNLKTGEIIE